MAETKRELALQNLVATLEAITTANGYDNNMGFVSREALAWDDVPPDKFPAAFAVSSVENPARHTFAKYRSSWTVTVGVMVRASTDRSTLVESMLGDVKRAVLVDGTRGGLANDTVLSQVRTLQGLEEPINYFELDLTIEYDHDKNAP